jgi:hypothetical protein
MVGYKPRAPKNNAKNFMGFEDEDSTSDSDGEHGVTGVGGAKVCSRKRLGVHIYVGAAATTRRQPSRAGNARGSAERSAELVRSTV